MGILAHVDAGKTTLSEALLYKSGSIRRAGSVDKGDTQLDHHAIERARGITIFSKQAVFSYDKLAVTLLDTPGHVDFSAEMERTLQVLDCAVLVISGTDGIQGHTKTLWRLLERYQIPTFLFVNKMDLNGTDAKALLAAIKRELGEGCVDFSNPTADCFYEEVAVCSEDTLERYLNGVLPDKGEMTALIKERKLFPCFFGSARKGDGVEELLEGIKVFAPEPSYPGEFGAKVFKIARDSQGNRLTYLKVTGGSLKVKMQLFGKGKDGKGDWEEKVNQIRIYSGEKYEAIDELSAGRICAVTGLSQTYPGEGLGGECASFLPLLEPVLSYQIVLPKGIDAAIMLPKLRLLEEEEPALHICWREETKEILLQLMGEVQIEVLKNLILERFGTKVEFCEGNIVYKETIADTVEGIGHFEPLRHYAEVHLLMEPGEEGSGLVFDADCSEELLAPNWQRLILTHLEEKEHIGVLTGSPITDMKITLVAGRAHSKHTEGGDFRQATYRAIRQGLMQASSVLLEPYYHFQLEIPTEVVGRAMTDLDRMHGKFVGQKEHTESGMLTLSGTAPVFGMANYQREVAAYTKGQGKLTCTMGGYTPCHNADEVIRQRGYDPQRDVENPTGSVFCAHGAGFVVEWNLVRDYMHLESCLPADSTKEEGDVPSKRLSDSRPMQEKQEEVVIGTEEIDRILDRAYNANKREKSPHLKNNRKRARTDAEAVGRSAAPRKRSYDRKSTKEYLLVDGYNIMFAWEELRELAKETIDGARGRLLDILCNYQAIRKCELIVVFDAYKVEGHKTESLDYHNIHVVYTREAETADQYIERFAHENGEKYRVTVATSDWLEQIIIRGAGCLLLSARELLEEINCKNEQIKEEFGSRSTLPRNYLLDEAAEGALREAIKEKPQEGNGRK
ncbi:MAG: NYN domain-containing protein [Roseburia sp.]